MNAANEQALKNKDYLGDGVYVGHDGYHIWIYTSNGIAVTNEVALDNHVLDAFKRWLKQLEEQTTPQNENDTQPMEGK